MSQLYSYGLHYGLEHQKTLLNEPRRESFNLSIGRSPFRAFLEKAVSWFEARMTELGQVACFGPEPACEMPFVP